MPKDHREQKQVSTLLVMGIVVLFILAMCSGCSTVVPVTAKFPEPPGRGAMTRCADLQKLKDDARLSDVASTVVTNYGTYYECAVRADAWQEWYEIQKRIFEGAGR
jgi:hypothetical protein